MKSALAALVLAPAAGRAGAAQLRGRARRAPALDSRCSTATACRCRRCASTRRCAPRMGAHRRNLAGTAARHRAQRGQALPRTQRRRLARRGRERLGQPVEHAHARRLDADHAARRPDRRLGAPAGGRSVAAKLGQAFTATQLERAWSKSQILEAYSTPVPLRGELVGVGAIAQTCSPSRRAGWDDTEGSHHCGAGACAQRRAQRVAQRACEVLKQQTLPAMASP